MLLIGAFKVVDDNAVRYLEKLAKKLALLIESNDCKFNIWLVQFPAKKHLLHYSQDVLHTS